MKTNFNLPVFMGVCESALVRGDGVLQDFYGVGDLVILPFFPQNLRGIFLLIGLSKEIIEKKNTVRFIITEKEKSKNKAWSDLVEVSTGPASEEASISGFSKHYKAIETEEKSKTDTMQMCQRLLIPQELIFKLIPILCPPLLVKGPTKIDVIAEIDGSEFKIGAFECMFCPTPPISEEERMAIMSRPGATKKIVYGLGCKKCHTNVQFHLSLDGSDQPPNNFKESIFLTTAPDEWNCKCGITTIPLTYLKKGFHELFRRTSIVGGQKKFHFIPLYQRGAISAILKQYQSLLSQYSGSEEEIQKFMESNHIIWNFLAPFRIWPKPPLLTKYQADFAILTRNGILYFIEIEKPTTKLIKSDGGLSAELQAGLDQIRNWRILIGRHRVAVLDSIKGLNSNMVSDIRYILVAGMANQNSLEALEKIRSMKSDADMFFCFDELATFLHSTEIALLNI